MNIFVMSHLKWNNPSLTVGLTFQRVSQDDTEADSGAMMTFTED